MKDIPVIYYIFCLCFILSTVIFYYFVDRICRWYYVRNVENQERLTSAMIFVVIGVLGMAVTLYQLMVSFEGTAPYAAGVATWTTLGLSILISSYVWATTRKERKELSKPPPS